jgi:hypothetical protein
LGVIQDGENISEQLGKHLETGLVYHEQLFSFGNHTQDDWSDHIELWQRITNISSGSLGRNSSSLDIFVA